MEQDSEAFTPPRKGCERSTQYGLALHCPRRCLGQYQKPTRRFFQCMLISKTETVRARSLSNPRLLPRRPRRRESASGWGPSTHRSHSHQMPRTKTTPNRSRELTTTSKSSAHQNCTTTCISGRRSPRTRTSSCGRCDQTSSIGMPAYGIRTPLVTAQYLAVACLPKLIPQGV